MSDKKIYLVYRVYSKKEQPDHDIGPVLYGWTFNKNIIKAFLSQRSEGKYYVEKMRGDIQELVDGEYNDLDTNNMINFVKLKSVENQNEHVYLFMTANEMQEAEKRIQRHFRDMCSISEIKGHGDYLEMFLHIEDYFADALDFIGYRPPEISMMCPAADYRDDPGEIMGITELIEQAYSGGSIAPYEMYENKPELPGLSMLTDVASKILYSVESFIKVLREDL